ncbi:MAG: efflux RND transporter periplasmic adaptor subunit [Betaproteobacteria bacterium]
MSALASTRGRRGRWLALAAIALILVGAEAWYATRPRATIVATTPIVIVHPSREFALLDSTGYVVAPRKATISSKVSGRLEWLGVAEGSRVKAGEVIARLEAGDVKARQDMLIRAPFDGVILSKSADVGDLVTPFSSRADSKRAVASIADMSTLEIEADVSAANLVKVRVGQPCEIVLDALPDARFLGTVARIVPAVDRAKATVKVHFDAIDQRVLPEMSARVSFLSQMVTAEQQLPLTAVSAGALTQRDGRTVLYVIRDDKAAEVAVTPGRKLGELTVFVGEAGSGERAVLDPSSELKVGALIRPAAK